MRFVAVHGDAFGLLGGTSLTFGPGLTVVHGDNEAGKSTWLDALLVGLGGLRRGPGQRAADASFLDRRRPWGRPDDDFRIRLVVERDDGSRIELSRDLAANLCSAVDLLTGRPVEVPVHDGAQDGARWLGLDRATFPLVAAVRQTEVLAVRDHPERMRELLQRAAATSADGVTAREALATIDGALREQVGTRRSTAVKPLRRALDGLARAEAGCDEARRRHEERRRLVADGGDLRQELGGLEHLAAELDAAITRLDAAEVVRRHRRAKDLVDALDALPVVDAVSATAARRGTELLAAAEAMPADPTPPERPAAEVEALLRRLPSVDGHDEHPHQEVVAAAAAVDHCRAGLAAHEAAPPDPAAPTEEQVDQWRAWLQQVAGPRPHADRRPRWERRPTVLVSAAVVLVVAGVVAVGTGMVGAGLAGLVAGLGCAVAAAAARSRPAPSRSAPAPAGEGPEAARAALRAAGFDPDDPAAAVSRLTDMVRAAGLRAAWEAERVRRHGQLADLAGELAGRLAARPDSVPPPGDGVAAAQAAYAAYVVRCGAAAATNAVARTRPGLERELRESVVAERAVTQHQRAVDGLRAQLEETLVRLGGPATARSDTAELGDLVEAVRQAIAPALVAIDARPARAGAEAELSGLLHGRSLHDLAEEAVAARRVLEDGPGRVDDGAGDRADLVRRLDAVVARRDECASQLAGCQGRLSALPEPGLAEAEAALEAARSEVGRLERFEATLRRARHHLEQAEQAAYRFIAPPLAARVSGWLPEVTAGRYREALVDPETLAVTVREAGGHLRPAGGLSHGTAEQIYLLLRLAMCELLTAPGEVCPVLLDEVTVHADEVRTEAVLAVLQGVATQRQVVVFTQEQRVVEWGRRAQLAGRGRLVELGPGGTVRASAA